MAGADSKRGKIQVMVVDDHELMRSGLIQLIEQEEDMEVCAQAADAHGALEEIEKHQCDVAVVDISLRDSSGIELIKDLKIRRPKLPVLVLSMHGESFYAERVLRAGARGYVTKDEASTKVIAGLRAVMAGEVYVSEKVTAKMLGRMIGRAPTESFPIDRLTDREFEVFELIGSGLSTRDIAQQLHLSIKTIETYREHIKAKLNLDGATELITYAVQWAQSERQP
jgi:DNA-binding NarL/FixJ family response regulator